MISKSTVALSLSTSDGGLPKFAAALRSIAGLATIKITPVQIWRKIKRADTYLPVQSSAAYLEVADVKWCVSWPIPQSITPPDDPIAAPFFLWEGRCRYFPIIRLVEIKNKRLTNESYYTLDDWLSSAICKWKYNAKEDNKESKSSTLADQLNKLKLDTRLLLSIVGRIIKYCLVGKHRKREDRLMGIFKSTKLSIPDCESPWLRVCDDDYEQPANIFGMQSVRSTVITAVVESADAIPTLVKTTELVKELRYQPSKKRPSGIDAYHTPEHSDIRLRLHTGLGTKLVNQEIRPIEENPYSLSLATSQIPFAGYNDPRRLLLAAKAQEQAVNLCEPESPLVVTQYRDDNLADPSGVNLRIGYLAWAGWNHEDAWVISESAAKKLACIERHTQDIPISRLACSWTCTPVDNEVHLEDPLVTERFLPSLLYPDINNLKARLINIANDSRSANPEVPNFSQLYETLSKELESGIPVVNKSSYSQTKGKVKQIYVWNFDQRKQGRYYENPQEFLENAESFPDSLEIPEAILQKFRAVVSVTVARTRPLQVGDKLANRHGHKGIVGLILPDDRMPHWNGKPLEALIDPISVLNRGNWGQIYETLAGAIAATSSQGPVKDNIRIGSKWLEEFRTHFQDSDEHGRCLIEAPSSSQWFNDAKTESSFRALIGSQFIMRMPEHAAEKISVAKPQNKGSISIKKREQKIDIQSLFAMWAHGLKHTSQRIDSESVQGLRTRLWLAGVYIDINGSPVTIQRMNLSDLDKVPSEVKEAKLSMEVKGVKKMAAQLNNLEQDKLYYIKLKKPLKKDEKPSVNLPWNEIAWLPVVSLKNIEKYEETKKLHRPWLAKKLEKMCNYVCNFYKPSKAKKVRTQDDKVRELFKLLYELIYEAIQKSIGTSKNHKKSWFAQNFQAYRRDHSGRAIIAPSGLPSAGHCKQSTETNSLSAIFNDKDESLLGINEIGLPEAFYDSIFSGSHKDTKLAWIKRDPVLHRWGFLPVRCRKHNDPATIRLPASLLNALGADFDGDAVAVFAVNEKESEVARKSSPSQIALHDFFRVPLFIPGKQYIYGLHLLSTRNKALLKCFQEELKACNAPEWPPRSSESENGKTSELLKIWCKDASDKPIIDPSWWALLEKYALLALAADPGMGFGVFKDAQIIAELEVIKSGAAKSDYRGRKTENDKLNDKLIDLVLKGKSLELIKDNIDPICSIMVEAQPVKGKFGSQVRHIILGASNIDEKKIIAAQSLTEKLTQAVLSVKSIDKQLPMFAEYKKYLDPRKHNSNPTTNSDSNNQEPEWVSEIKQLHGYQEIEALLREMATTKTRLPKWQAWVDQPYNLLKLLHTEPESKELQNYKVIEIPLDDLRSCISRFK